MKAKTNYCVVHFKPLTLRILFNKTSNVYRFLTKGLIIPNLSSDHKCTMKDNADITDQ